MGIPRVDRNGKSWRGMRFVTISGCLYVLQNIYDLQYNTRFVVYGVRVACKGLHLRTEPVRNRRCLKHQIISKKLTVSTQIAWPICHSSFLHLTVGTFRYIDALTQAVLECRAATTAFSVTLHTRLQVRKTSPGICSLSRSPHLVPLCIVCIKLRSISLEVLTNRRCRSG